MATSAARTIGTTLIDLLELVRGRAPLTDKDVAAATGANQETVAAWLDRKAAPAEEQAARLSERIAAVERLEVSRLGSPWPNPQSPWGRLGSRWFPPVGTASNISIPARISRRRVWK